MKHLYLSLYEMNNTEIYGGVELADCCSYVNISCFLYVYTVKLVSINEKRFNMVEDKKFELYYCYYKDELVYIGHGKAGRHKHCLSGKSHCRELNQIVLTEGLDNLRVEVVYRANDRFKTLMREKEDIVGLQPKFNKDGKSRLDLLDNKKRKYPEDDVLMLKYLHWRGISAKSLKTLFYFMWSSHVEAILDNSYYKSIKLTFLVNGKGKVFLIYEELELFEEKYSSNIEKYCRMMSAKMKSELLDIGNGSTNRVIKENRFLK